LKHPDYNNVVTRRQEVGCSLRLSVNQSGDRMDHPAVVHEVNVLTVVASESYSNFVAALQKDISESLSARPRVADEAYFTGKVLKSESGDIEVTPQLAKQIYKYLLKHDYSDDADRITSTYHQAKQDGTLAALPPELALELAPHTEQIFKLIDAVFSDSQLPEIGDDRKPKKNPLNDNFDKQAFRELWQRINHKAAYRVDFDSAELVQKAVKSLNDKDAWLRVVPLQYSIQRGEQSAQVTYDGIKDGRAFELKVSETESNRASIHSAVKYDLIGKLAEGTQLTRRTVAEILKGLNVAVFAQFKTNPESFIAEAIRLINEQKATVIIEHLAYDPVEDKFDLDIFTAGQTQQDFSNAVKTPRHHIYDFVLPDSVMARA
jgi:type III restriction enzyme